MAASMQLTRVLTFCRLSKHFHGGLRRFSSTISTASEGASDSAQTESHSAEGGTEAGLRKAFETFSKVDKHILTDHDDSLSAESAEEPKSFAALLKNSKLMQIGDPEGRIVIGTIIEAIGDDLYIDFGGKFHCVCKSPRVQTRDYRPGVEVKVRLHALELSSLFLGGDRDITLLEADATLIGLNRQAKSPVTNIGSAVKQAVSSIST